MIKLFYHLCCFDCTPKIVEDQIVKILFSGAYETMDEILCFLVGQPGPMEECKRILLKSGSKFKIVEEGPNDTTYERFTLEKIHKYVEDTDKFLYLHTKGVTKPNHSNVKDWKNLMEYACLVKHKKCIDLLDTHHTVGVNWKTSPVPHYSGNIWWTTGKYLKSLPPKVGPEYCDPEFWIGLNNPKMACIWNTEPFDHYKQAYPFSAFIDSFV
jgi:hypothetical protein